MKVKGHMLAVFKEGSQKQTHYISTLYLINQNLVTWSYIASKDAGKCSFDSILGGLFSAKIGDSTTMKTRGTGY